MHIRLLLAILAIAACIASYLQGLFGGFIFDDYQNIVENAAIQQVNHDLSSWIAAAVSSGSGMLRRPISMLSFALNDHLFGMSPIAFKAVNLAIHLVIGCLIYAIFRRLLPLLLPASESPWSNKRVDRLSFVVAAIWLLHPLNVSSVLYVVQRMNQLSTLFILTGVLSYIIGRQRALNGQSGLLVALMMTLISSVLAIFSKENGALIFMYLFVVEWAGFRFKGLRYPEKWVISGYFTLFLVLPALAIIAFLGTNPDWILGGYQYRDFTFSERLYTQPRILLHYLYWIVLPLPPFMGMYHDDIATSSGLLSPLTTLFAIAIIVTSVLAAIRLKGRYPAFTFAVLWFLVGHSMESSIISLEQVFEHRNYAPMIGVIVGLIVPMAVAAQRIGLSAQVGLAMAALALLVIGTITRAHTWGDPVRLAVKSAEHHPDSPRSQYDAGRMVYMSAMTGNDSSRAAADSKPYFLKAMALADSYIHPVISIMLTQHREMPVPPNLVGELTRRIAATKRLEPNPVLQLQDAITDGRVQASETDMLRIFEATMDNDSLNSAARAQLLNNYGRYHFVVRNDRQAAVTLTLAAAAESPANPVYQINLAKLALALGEPERAKHYLNRAAELDIANINREQISVTEGKILSAIEHQTSIRE